MGYRYNDLTNQIFGNLEVIQFDHTDKKYSYWQCKCLCGNPQIFVKRVDTLKNHHPSCGCIWKEKLKVNIKQASNIQSQQRRQELIGKQFGELTVLSFHSVNVNGGIIWECQCSCGYIGHYSTSTLNSGHTRSCGCIKSFKEKEITQLLLDKQIIFRKEYIFSDLLSENNGYLRFDFALFNGTQLVGLIEYHGKQHYNSDSGWSDTKYHERDRIKEEYCKINNIPLLIVNKDNYNCNLILSFYNSNVGG